MKKVKRMKQTKINHNYEYKLFTLAYHKFNNKNFSELLTIACTDEQYYLVGALFLPMECYENETALAYSEEYSVDLTVTEFINLYKQKSTKKFKEYIRSKYPKHRFFRVVYVEDDLTKEFFELTKKLQVPLVFTI
tara:strand:+ start:2502 stop:2906 length:405 start_codon:yes stop_codon:yes gene_type:complete